MGRLVVGDFRDGIQPLDNDQQRQMLYMQSKLEISMKSEFNDSLGHVNFILTFRDNLVIINIPLKNQKYHILISAEKSAEVRKIVDDVIGYLEQNEPFSNQNRHQNEEKLENFTNPLWP